MANSSSPNSSAKVFIDGAEFDIRPTRRVQSGSQLFYGPPPPYVNENEFSQNISPPAYSMGLPPPYDPKDPNRIKRRKLGEFTEEYYLTNYMEIEWLHYLGPGCVCDSCLMYNGEIIEEKGLSCELWDYDYSLINQDWGGIYSN